MSGDVNEVVSSIAAIVISNADTPTHVQMSTTGNRSTALMRRRLGGFGMSRRIWYELRTFLDLEFESQCERVGARPVPVVSCCWGSGGALSARGFWRLRARVGAANAGTVKNKASLISWRQVSSLKSIKIKTP